MDINKLIESLSINEIKILPHLKEGINEICEKTDLDRVSVLRSLEYLEKKEIVLLEQKKTKIVDLGVNGILYKRKGLPERNLLKILREKRVLSLQDAQSESNLSDDEFRASIGVLRRKNMIDLKNEKIMLESNHEEISKKIPEEHFIESLPLEYNSLSKDQLQILSSLEKRKEMLKISEEKTIKIKVTDLGERIINSKIKDNLIEQITPKILKKDSLWRGKKFRRYDVVSHVPKIYGGKRHFVNQAIDYGKKTWTEMGFKEMTGNIIQSSFWNFDALFTAQDHPVREIQDTFFLNEKGELPDKKIVKAVKQAHEKGVGGSKGWQYSWDEEEAKRLVLRTHTTPFSAQTLAKLKEEDLPGKFFAIGWNFRNETVDWKHGFEFLQTEGIVIDKDANFRHLLGYLKEFSRKMGFEKVRFRPAYFPYTEPSVEGDVWNEEKQEWVEYIAAGIFRPEVVIPLLGENIPVLAWGPGFGRMLMKYYGIKDLRELQKNNIDQLRKMKAWMK